MKTKGSRRRTKITETSGAIQVRDTTAQNGCDVVTPSVLSPSSITIGHFKITSNLRTYSAVTVYANLLIVYDIFCII